MDLSVCFITLELFNWGLYGGIGKATRKIGSELVKRGVQVQVVMPRGKGQGKEEDLEGMTVSSFPISSYPFTSNIYRESEADIFHSQEPSWGTLIARKSCPDKKHVVTIQNPRTVSEWNQVYQFYLPRRRIFNHLFQGKISKCVKNSDRVMCQAQYTIEKAKKIYNLQHQPMFLPNPVDIPPKPRKSTTPTACFLGRLDGEKRPSHFFELAKQFPEVDFLVMGKSHDKKRQSRIEKEQAKIGNLELLGFMDGAEKDEVLARSWILVNTSVSECLPVAFLEAAASRCAILSYHDPDGFASRGGCHVSPSCLVGGLRWLLDEDRWRSRGEAGYEYVCKVHETSKVIDQHLELYGGVVEK